MFSSDNLRLWAKATLYGYLVGVLVGTLARILSLFAD
jgi:hypothetical protein